MLCELGGAGIEVPERMAEAGRGVEDADAAELVAGFGKGGFALREIIGRRGEPTGGHAGDGAI